MIDNLALTKFVLENEKLTSEEKQRFVDDVAEMTDEEKLFYVWSLGLENMTKLWEEVSAVEDQAGFADQDIDQAVEKYLLKKAEKSDQEHIEEIQAKLQDDIKSSQPS